MVRLVLRVVVGAVLLGIPAAALVYAFPRAWPFVSAIDYSTLPLSMIAGLVGLSLAFGVGWALGKAVDFVFGR